MKRVKRGKVNKPKKIKAKKQKNLSQDTTSVESNENKGLKCVERLIKETFTLELNERPMIEDIMLKFISGRKVVDRVGPMIL